MPAVRADPLNTDAVTTVVETTAPNSRWRWGGPLLATLIGLAIWGLSLRGVEIRETSDLGLITAMPWWTALGPLLLIGAFVWTLWRPPSSSRVRTALLVLETLVLIVMLFGTGPILEPLTANHVAWRHVGIADAIQRNGIDGTIDAYFNWPGFFTMAAIAVEAVGPLETVRAVAWTPVVLNTLYVLPVFLLARWLFRDDVPAWTAVWIFLLGNWVGQDYFAPQAFAYFGYLVIIVLLATSIADDDVVDGLPMGTELSARKVIASRPMTLAIILVIYAWIVVSHQLTPIAVLIVVGTLVVMRRSIPWQLLAVMVLMQIAWFSFSAVDYLRGNLQVLVDQLGDIDQIARSNISSRVGGSAAHIAVVRLRMLTVVGLAIGGFLGWFMARRGASEKQRRRLITVGLIGAAPFTLLALGSYGGEIALRAYLFALPVLAIYTAALITVRPPVESGQDPPKRKQRIAAATAAGLVVLLAIFPFTKYGNENSLYFTTEEFSVIEKFYEVAPPGSLVVSATSNLPWKWQGYTDYKYRTLSQLSPLPALDELDGRVRELMESRDGPAAYVLLTRSQGAFNDSFGVWNRGAIEQLRERLEAAGDFVLVFDSGDGVLFKYVR